jgi:hypothetical protein
MAGEKGTAYFSRHGCTFFKKELKEKSLAQWTLNGEPLPKVNW